MNQPLIQRHHRTSTAIRKLVAVLQQPVAGHQCIDLIRWSGGVGTSTVAVLLGHTLAAARHDRVLVIPDDEGRQLRERLPQQRDIHSSIGAPPATFNELSAATRRGGTQADIVCSSSTRFTGPQPLSNNYRRLGRIHYNFVIQEHPNQSRVSGFDASPNRGLIFLTRPDVNGARTLSSALNHMMSLGLGPDVRAGTIVVNGVGDWHNPEMVTSMIRHFDNLCANVIAIPYDPALAAGSAINPSLLQPATRHAYRELAAATISQLNRPMPTQERPGLPSDVPSERLFTVTNGAPQLGRTTVA